MMVAVCKTAGIIEVLADKMDDLTADAAKTDARLNLLSYSHKSIVETLNLNLGAFDKIQKDLTA